MPIQTQERRTRRKNLDFGIGVTLAILLGAYGVTRVENFFRDRQVRAMQEISLDDNRNFTEINLNRSLNKRYGGTYSGLREMGGFGWFELPDYDPDKKAYFVVSSESISEPRIRDLGDSIEVGIDLLWANSIQEEVRNSNPYVNTGAGFP